MRVACCLVPARERAVLVEAAVDPISRGLNMARNRRGVGTVEVRPADRGQDSVVSASWESEDARLVTRRLIIPGVVLAWSWW